PRIARAGARGPRGTCTWRRDQHEEAAFPPARADGRDQGERAAHPAVDRARGRRHSRGEGRVPRLRAAVRAACSQGGSEGEPRPRRARQVEAAARVRRRRAGAALPRHQQRPRSLLGHAQAVRRADDDAEAGQLQDDQRRAVRALPEGRPQGPADPADPGHLRQRPLGQLPERRLGAVQVRLPRHHVGDRRRGRPRAVLPGLERAAPDARLGPLGHRTGGRPRRRQHPRGREERPAAVLREPARVRRRPPRELRGLQAASDLGHRAGRLAAQEPASRLGAAGDGRAVRRLRSAGLELGRRGPVPARLAALALPGAAPAGPAGVLDRRHAGGRPLPGHLPHQRGTALQVAAPRTVLLRLDGAREAPARGGCAEAVPRQARAAARAVRGPLAQDPFLQELPQHGGDRPSRLEREAGGASDVCGTGGKRLMCGITGYVGSRPAEELLLAGLERLEYRGYDSAGIALLSDGALDKVRAVGNLEALRKRVARENRRSARSATIGIGHTRWATHGRVEERNAHPHSDHHGRFEVVLNGIVENFASLRTRLEGEGYRFNSDTDAEAVAHLISYHFEGDLPAAVGAACKELEGHYAFVVMCADEPDMLVAARRECPLVIGRGEGEQFLASDIPAFLGETRNVQYVDNDELVVVRPDGVDFFGHDGRPLDRAVKVIDWDPETAEKAGYDTFMLKEIHEQPQAVARTVGDRIVGGDISLSGLGEIDQRVLAEARRIVLIGCGTSYHAGLIGRYAIEEWSRVPTELDVASEYRYRNPVVGSDDLVVGLSQSGETADTLAALRLARERGAKVLGVTNVMGSQITRETDGVLYTRAGIEIGVAATKTYVAQVAAMYLLAVPLAALPGTMPESRRSDLLGQLEAMPQQIDKLIADCDGPVRELAERYHRSEFF